MTTRTTDTGEAGRAPWPLARVLRDRNAGLYLAGVVVSGFGSSALGLAAGGMKLRAAAAQVAREQGLAKNALYEVAVKMRRPRDRSKTSKAKMPHS